MEQRTEGIRKQASDLIEQAYKRGYKNGENSRIDECAKALDEAVIAGRDEAWEAARKLVSMDYRERYEVLGDFVSDVEIFAKCTASEAIEKLHKYGEQKKQKETEGIHVGDVIQKHDVEAVVTWCDGKNWNGFLLGGEGVGEVGQVYSCMRCKGWKKTARHFPEISEVLKKMQEGD